jgi:hypothetical protein
VNTAFHNPNVKTAYEAFPAPERDILLQLREMVFASAAEAEGVGEIEETLKWGEPAYLTHKPRSGTTIRLSTSKTGSAAIFVHCQTTLISEFQALFPNDFTFEGNRAVYVDILTVEEADKLRLVITRALTYNQR